MVWSSWWSSIGSNHTTIPPYWFACGKAPSSLRASTSLAEKFTSCKAVGFMGISAWINKEACANGGRTLTQNHSCSDPEGIIVPYEKTSHFTNEEMKAKISEVAWPRSRRSSNSFISWLPTWIPHVTAKYISVVMTWPLLGVFPLHMQTWNTGTQVQALTLSLPAISWPWTSHLASCYVNLFIFPMGSPSWPCSSVRIRGDKSVELSRTNHTGDCTCHICPLLAEGSCLQYWGEGGIYLGQEGRHGPLTINHAYEVFPEGI